MLHPGLADVYRAKVADLSDALNVPETRAEATQFVRGMLSRIRLIPEGDKLASTRPFGVPPLGGPVLLLVHRGPLVHRNDAFRCRRTIAQ